MAPLPEPIEEEMPVDEEQFEARSMAFFEAENDSGRETLHDTDSEAEDAQSVLGQLIEDAFGWNVSAMMNHWGVYLFVYQSGTGIEYILLCRQEEKGTDIIIAVHFHDHHHQQAGRQSVSCRRAS